MPLSPLEFLSVRSRFRSLYLRQLPGYFYWGILVSRDDYSQCMNRHLFSLFCCHDLAVLACLTRLWSRLFLTLLGVHVRTILLLCYCWFLYRCSSADMLAALLWLCRYSALKNLGYPATIWSMIFCNWPHILLTGSVPSLKILFR